MINYRLKYSDAYIGAPQLVDKDLSIVVKSQKTNATVVEGNGVEYALNKAKILEKYLRRTNTINSDTDTIFTKDYAYRLKNLQLDQKATLRSYDVKLWNFFLDYPKDVSSTNGIVIYENDKTDFRFLVSMIKNLDNNSYTISIFENSRANEVFTYNLNANLTNHNICVQLMNHKIYKDNKSFSNYWTVGIAYDWINYGDVIPNKISENYFWWESSDIADSITATKEPDTNQDYKVSAQYLYREYK